MVYSKITLICTVLYLNFCYYFIRMKRTNISKADIQTNIQHAFLVQIGLINQSVVRQSVTKAS